MGFLILSSLGTSWELQAETQLQSSPVSEPGTQALPAGLTRARAAPSRPAEPCGGPRARSPPARGPRVGRGPRDNSAWKGAGSRPQLLFPRRVS